MEKKHNNPARILRRSIEELRASKHIANVVDFRGACAVFLAKAMIQGVNRGILSETPWVKKMLLHKHAVMQTYVDKTFRSYVEKYPFAPEVSASTGEEKRIWMCWWQGLDNAPEITKKCIASVQKNAGGHEVVVISEANYQEYVQLPAWIIEKYRKGTISRTHFSDVLRLFLLAEHGGLWLDSSVFCTGEQLQEYLHMPVWTIKRPGYGHLSVAGGRWVTGTMGCDEAHRWMFAVVRDFLLQYWRTHDMLMDYLILDYLIDLAVRNESRIADCFANIAPNNLNGDELLKVINEPFDEARWKELQENTGLFILSWKKMFLMEKSGCPTYYAMLMSGGLQKTNCSFSKDEYEQ